MTGPLSFLHNQALWLEILGVEVPRPAPKPRPVALAESLHREHGSALGSTPPYDVHALCRRLDIGAHAWRMPPEIAGLLLRRRDRHHIVVNSRHRIQRRRWTAAHELYHYLEHRHLLVPLACMLDEDPADEATRAREAAANQFAAELLAPADLTRELWRRHRRAPVIAAVFGLSVQAMRVRVEELGLWRRVPRLRY